MAYLRRDTRVLNMIVVLHIAFVAMFTPTSGHGYLTEPPPRGALYEAGLAPFKKPVDVSAPFDSMLHFPAGDRRKDDAGLRSQRREGGTWTPFTPLSPHFKWRSGVCGDLKSKTEAHRRGGDYFHNGMIVRNYVEGGSIDFEASLVGHHNGFFEFYICDVSKCGRDISEHCFRIGACKQLERAWVNECQVGKSKRCAPIDRNYPGRWYVPCPVFAEKGGFDMMGKDGTMKYILPEGLVCDHCVIQWFYSAANECNAPGVVDFYTGPDSPAGWDDCKGQSGAVGGYGAWMPTCGGKDFSQEYFNCADVRIVGRGVPKEFPFEKVEIGKIVDRKFIPMVELKPTDSAAYVKIGAKAQLTVRATLKWPVKELQFLLNDLGSSRVVRKSSTQPYFMFGMDFRGHPQPWKKPIMSRYIKLSASADGYSRGWWVFLEE